jgi:hypothetical protein
MLLARHGDPCKTKESTASIVPSPGAFIRMLEDSCAQNALKPSEARTSLPSEHAGQRWAEMHDVGVAFQQVDQPAK